MMRRLLPPFGPLAVAVVAAALVAALDHPAVAPTAAHSRPPTSVVLPVPRTAYHPAPGTSYHVTEESTCEFESDGTFRVLRARTDAIEGTMAIDDDGRPARLDVAIDLARLEPTDDNDDLDDDLHRLLGLSAGDRLHFTAHPAHGCTGPQVGLERIHWVGRLLLGAEAHRLGVDLWLVTTRADAVRLQGIAALEPANLSIPRRYFLGLLPEDNRITLGLDLVLRAEGR